MCACYLVFGNHGAFSFELFSDGRLFEPRDTVIDRLSDGIRFVKNFSRVPYFGVVRLTEPYLECVVRVSSCLSCVSRRGVYVWVFDASQC